MKRIRTTFVKIIRKLFFKYCYKPQTINAERYNIIPINSIVYVDERHIWGKYPYSKDYQRLEFDIKEELAKKIAQEIVNTINIEQHYDPLAQKFEYRARLFIAEDKPYCHCQWKKEDNQ